MKGLHLLVIRAFAEVPRSAGRSLHLLRPGYQLSCYCVLPRAVVYQLSLLHLSGLNGSGRLNRQRCHHFRVSAAFFSYDVG